MNTFKLLALILFLTAAFAISCSVNKQVQTLNYGQGYTPYYQVSFDFSDCVEGRLYTYQFTAI
jgi:hypothetical protein